MILTLNRNKGIRTTFTWGFLGSLTRHVVKAILKYSSATGGNQIRNLLGYKNEQLEMTATKIENVLGR